MHAREEALERGAVGYALKPVKRKQLVDAFRQLEAKFSQTLQRVLVVEDEDVVRLLVVEVLNDLGYLALEADDGASALRILQSSQRIDLLATDIGLPDINGRQVADAARAGRADEHRVAITTSEVPSR